MWKDIFSVVAFSSIAYAYLWVLAKLLGKKQIAQLTFVDYVIGITIGSIAAEMATELSQPFFHYLISMFIFFALDFAFTLIGRKGKIAKQIFVGKPIVIIENGKMNYPNLKKSKLTIDEILGLLREKGFFKIEDVSFALLETTGNLSVMPSAESTPTTVKDLGKIADEPSLETYFIIDGKIDYDKLHAMKKSVAWAFKLLDIKTDKDVKNILLAHYDEKNDKINAIYKNKKTS